MLEKVHMDKKKTQYNRYNIWKQAHALDGISVKPAMFSSKLFHMETHYLPASSSVRHGRVTVSQRMGSQRK